MRLVANNARSSSFSVYDAFKRGLNLPALLASEGRADAGISHGGRLAKATTPPKAWAPLDFEDSISAAYRFVEDRKRELADVSAVEVAGLTRLGGRPTNFDLGKLFNLHVMHPVEIALLQMKLPEAYELRVRSGPCMEERNGRAVVLEAVNLNQATAKPLAVLQLEGLGAVQDRLDLIMVAEVARQDAEALAPTSKPLFKADGLVLVKQCAANAVLFGTRHVAMCDWSVALYFDFAQLPQVLQAAEPETDSKTKTEGRSAGDFVLMHAQSNPDTFHYALLAFFKGAVDEWIQGLSTGEQ